MFLLAAGSLLHPSSTSSGPLEADWILCAGSFFGGRNAGEMQEATQQVESGKMGLQTAKGARCHGRGNAGGEGEVS